ncbi:sensor histidine kinase [Pistricoccus aurantiacus]|uniref:histidine kinase n=1 Tax=Pistricoccus aurantiacus TaxID=1883414 RepID=A0A5B8SPG6_9GAMM|nr:histidine kinase dimerization/phospho-acceptor domain-containing protein [Pistricoccus aurantiacus]QEA37907.1 two-component sensor histidine kinase [Pistricoccus aurantiacus]
MSTQASRRWRPHSLLQLVLLAFAMVMLPLGVLIFQASQTLSELTRLADVSARQAVAETRRARDLASLALQMERNARQYAVIEEPGLMDIYAERLAEYETLLDRQAQLLKNNPDVQALNRQIETLKQLPGLPQEELVSSLALFEPFARHTDALREATGQLIDQRIDRIRQRAGEVKSQLWWRAAGLVSISLVLMLLFTWLIIRPIRQLEQRILSLGGTGETQEMGRIQGPAEMVHLGTRLTWLAVRLEELEAQKQQFLRHMSHEFKTPLTSVREGTALLRDGVAGELKPSQHEVLELIDQSGEELQRLIEQLLDYNLLKYQSEPHVSRFDVRTMVDELLAKHRLALESKRMQVNRFEKSLVWKADAGATQRILDNLLSNALAYGEDGGQLDIRARRDHGLLVIEVANSGEPIPQSDRPKLYEPFFQGKARRKGSLLQGSGIGLSVAADCASSQSGTLELVDDDRLAVCFRLSLPWLKDDDKVTQEETHMTAIQ